jgi:hypothetical protein
MALLYLASLVLFLPRLLRPTLWFDDFAYLRDSWSWDLALAHLWLPFNEHAMPLARLSTWLLVRAAGNAANLPWLLGLQGPVAVWVGMGLVYRFLRRELGGPARALAGMALFGVSSQYFEAVWWYSATFALLALDTFLLGLLAAQRYRQTGERRHLAGCALAAALAPGWYGGGILAGPLCALYLLPPPRTGRTGLAGALTPLLGTAAFLAVALPRAGGGIVRPSHFSGRSILEAYDPLVGVRNSGRALVDNLLVGSLGLPPLPLPLWLALLLLAGALLVGALWWRAAPHRRLLGLGLGCALGSYVLIHSARAAWNYADLCYWTRYQVFAHLGFVLFVTGGLPVRGGRLAAPRWLASPSRRLFALTALLAVTQFPRAWFGFPFEPRQHAQLRQVDAVDARCRRHHIDRDTARAALPPMVMAGGSEVDNAWFLLRGSEGPRPVGHDEARRLLAPPP